MIDFLKYWKELLMPAVALLIFALLGVEEGRIHSLKTDVAGAHEQVKELGADLEKQNAAVKSLGDTAKTLAATNDRNVLAAIQAALLGRTATSKQVAGIKAAKPGTDACASALGLIHGAGQ